MALLLAGGARAHPGEVELDYRLRPNRDLTAKTLTDAVTTLRVLQDRGVVAKSNGRLSAQPTTIRITESQTLHYLTGGEQADGSFTAVIRFIEKTGSIKTMDGRELDLAGNLPFKALHIVATVESSGKVRDDAVRVSGVDAAMADMLRPMMAVVISKVASIEPIWLSRDRSVPQEFSMQMPIAGKVALNLRMTISNRLLSVGDGVARIQQFHEVTFGAPSGAVMLSAEGSGSGVLLCEVATRALLSSESQTLMKSVLDTPDGVIEVQVNGKQTQSMRPTREEARSTYKN